MSTLVTDPEILKQLAAVPYEAEVSNNSNNNDKTIPTAVKKELNYSERLNALVQNRAKEVSGTFKKLEDAEIGYGSAALRTVGKGFFGTAGDVIGETVATGASAITPDFIEDPFKQAMVSLVGEAVDSDVGKEAVKIWNGLDTNTKANLESAGNIVNFMLPKLKVSGVGTKIKNKGQAIKKARLSDYMKLPDSPSQKVKEARRRFSDPVGHKQMIDVISTVKGFNPNVGLNVKSTKKNLLLLEKEINNTEQKLKSLVNNDPRKINKQEVFDKISENISEEMAERSWLVTDQSINKSIELNLATAKKILDKHPDTAAGLLKAKREIQTLLDRKKLEQPANELTARDTITNTVRKSVNEVLGSRYSDDAFNSLMNREHNLLKGVTNLAEKYGAETDNVKVALKFASQHPLLTMSALGGGGLVSGVLTNPTFVYPGLAAGAGYAIYRGLPSGLKALGKSLEVGSKQPLPLTRTGLLYGYDDDDEQKEEEKIRLK